jgi:hypothetical protein
MNRRLYLVLAAVSLLLVLAGCRNEKTQLIFNNKTECGTAAITITNTNTGNLNEYSLDEGRELTVTIDHGVTYRYEINYTGRAGSNLECEPKSGTVLVPERGQESTFNLVSATATPTAE